MWEEKHNINTAVKKGIKLAFYKVMAFTTRLYGSEILVKNNSNIIKIQVAKMKCLTCVRGVRD
jgi:molybdopterin/thiamine biosynthesis adenylyltransferase